MNLKRLHIRSFRGYENLEVELEKGMNVLVGSNGAGKTNAVEAISFLASARSFKTKDESELRKKGTTLTELKGDFEVGRRMSDVFMTLTPKGKKVMVRGHEVKKLSELVSEFHVITFQPEDVFLFDASPSERRKWMNQSVSQSFPHYLHALNRYEKILAERNNVLKENEPNRMHLDSLTEMLVEVAEEIVRYRTQYFQKAFPIASALFQKLNGGEQTIDFSYQPFIPFDSAFKENAYNAFQRSLENDLRYGATTIGPHREDFACLLNDRKIDESGSQGEKRIAALALRLTPYSLFEKSEEYPIVILDDVLSELDEKRKTNLLQVVSTYEQVFITTTEWKRKEYATVYDVDHHIWTRRSNYGR